MVRLKISVKLNRKRDARYNILNLNGLKNSDKKGSIGWSCFDALWELRGVEEKNGKSMYMTWNRFIWLRTQSPVLCRDVTVEKKEIGVDKQKIMDHHRSRLATSRLLKPLKKDTRT